MSPGPYRLAALLVLATCLASERARADIRCGDAFLDAPTHTPGVGEASCTVREKFRVEAPDSKSFVVLETSDFGHHGSNWHARNARDAITRAAQRYGRLARVPETAVIFTADTTRYPVPGTRRRGRILGETIPDIIDGRCWLIVNEGTILGEYGTPAGERELKLTIAHEMFHCLQWNNWERKAEAEGSSWWVEGSAEYFQHVALPEYPVDPDRIADFDAASAARPLFELFYHNVVFFSFLGGPRGLGNPESMISLLAGMPESGGLDAQRAAAAAFPRMGELFQTFVEDYLDDRITDPGGRPLGVSPPMEETFRVRDEIELEVQITPWTAKRRRVALPSGTNWRIVRVHGDPVDGRARLRYAEAREDWSDPTFEVLSCREERTVLVGASAAPSDTARRDVVLRVEEVRGDSRDCPCPLGSWTIPRDQIEANSPFVVAGWLASDESSRPDPLWKFSLLSGSPRLVFNGDGTAHYRAELVFRSGLEDQMVPAVCANDACVRECLANRRPRSECAVKRSVTLYNAIEQVTDITWRWRARDGKLYRETLAVEGHTAHIFFDGFQERRTVTPTNTGLAAPTEQRFRCDGEALVIERSAAPGGTSTARGAREEMLRRLESGSPEQQQAAAAMRQAEARRRGTDPDAGDRVHEALSASSSSPAHPWAGRFVRP